MILFGEVVGASGFEPEASCAQGRRATRLRYAPTRSAELILKHFSTLLLLHFPILDLDCTSNCTRMPSLDRGCTRFQCHFVCLTVQFLQRFSLHLQLHLRVAFEDLRVSLAK